MMRLNLLGILNLLTYKRFIFFFKKDSRLGLRHFVPDPVIC